MKPAVSTATGGPVAPADVPPGSFLDAWARFWFLPADPVALHRVRLLTGLLLLSWLLPLAGQREALFGAHGWFDARAYREVSALPEGLPQAAGWSVLYLCASSPALLTVAYWTAGAILVAYAVGLWTRLTAGLAWVVVLSFTVNPVAMSEADPLLVLLALYLMLGYLFQGAPDRAGLASRILGANDPILLGRRIGSATVPSVSANLALRLLQVHFALVVVISGLHKLQFPDWWSGAALWYPLHPPLQLTLERLRAEVHGTESTLGALSLAAYAGLAWQLGFPAFAWRRSWRPLLLAGAAIGWAVTALVYHEPVFGPAYAVCCLSYVSPEEWRRLGGRLDRLLRWRRKASADATHRHARTTAGNGHAVPVLTSRHP